MHIIGAGGHSKVVIDILRDQDVEIIGVWDEKLEGEYMGVPILGVFEKFKISGNTNVLIAIGNNKIRRKLSIELGRTTGHAVHPTSYVSRSASIDAGTVVMPNASINSDAKIGKHVIINTNSSIDHDCVIYDYAHISPNAVLGGNVEIGEGAHVGIGSTIIQGIKVGKWATVGAGSVIIKDVPAYAVVVGNPGRVVKYSPKEDE